jgi:hypothetical protein
MVARAPKNSKITAFMTDGRLAPRVVSGSSMTVVENRRYTLTAGHSVIQEQPRPIESRKEGRDALKC